jgi:hypothetical protein
MVSQFNYMKTIYSKTIIYTEYKESCSQAIGGVNKTNYIA